MEKPSLSKQLENNFLSEGRQRRLDILNEVAGGKIWLEVGWIDIKGRRVRRHSWDLVKLERFIKHLKELDRRVENRIIFSGSLHFFINSEVKNEMIKRNLWGAEKNRETFFGKEEDEGEVTRFYFPITRKFLTLRGLYEKMKKFRSLKT